MHGFHYYPTNARKAVKCKRTQCNASNARIACNTVDATTNASKARNAVDANAPNATANARNAVDAKTHPAQATHATQKQNEFITHSMHYHCLLCFESICVNYILSAYAGCIFAIQATTSQM